MATLWLGLWLGVPLLAQAPSEGQALAPTHAAARHALRTKGPEQARAALEVLERGPAADFGLRYLRAIALARLGRTIEAAALANDLERLDPGFEAAEDPELAGLALPRRSGPGQGRMRTVFQLTRPRLFPEGIAVDPATGRTFLSSLGEGGVFVIDRAGKLSPFVTAGEAGPWRTLGLKVDAGRGLLWIASNAGAEKGRPARSAVFAADLKTGTLNHRIPAPEGGKHLLNDLALGADGSVYVSDSEAGTVYRIPAGKGRMEPVLPAGRLDYPNGLVPTLDGKGLLVAAQGPGLFRLNLADATLREIAVPEGLHLQGIDGLTRHGRGLLAVQNGLPPGRVVALELDETETRLRSLRILVAAHAALRGIPTTGDLAGNRYRIIANSQMDLLAKPGATPQPFRVVDVDLMERP